VANGEIAWEGKIAKIASADVEECACVNLTYAAGCATAASWNALGFGGMAKADYPGGENFISFP
jgi:hypothetical protein